MIAQYAVTDEELLVTDEEPPSDFYTGMVVGWESSWVNSCLAHPSETLRLTC